MNSDREVPERDEEIRQLRATLRKMQYELAEANLQVESSRVQARRAQESADVAWDQLRLLRASHSWKAMAPLRFVKDDLRRVLR